MQVESYDGGIGVYDLVVVAVPPDVDDRDRGRTTSSRARSRPAASSTATRSRPRRARSSPSTDAVRARTAWRTGSSRRRAPSSVASRTRATTSARRSCRRRATTRSSCRATQGGGGTYDLQLPRLAASVSVAECRPEAIAACARPWIEPVIDQIGAKRSRLATATVDVVSAVLDRQRPLLHLPPRRQEHAAVVLVQPVGVAVAGVVAAEVAVVADAHRREHDGALGPVGADVAGQAVPAERVADPLDELLAQLVEVG